jgi:glycosyltransferase involved in cell wall biosynthesis
MVRTFFYYHRLEFPSSSGQTIQVLRDYHSLASRGHAVHLAYRSQKALGEADIGAALRGYGLVPRPGFEFHPLLSRRHMRRLAAGLAGGAAGPFVLVARTMDSAAEALRLRRRLACVRPTQVLLELHETAIPHMVYREQGRWVRALLSLWRERRVFRAVDGIICTVGSQRALLDRLFPGHAAIVVLPNGAPLDAYAMHAKARPDDGAVHLRYAGQLNAWKNTGLMIEALPLLPENVVLDIAGGRAGEEERTRENLMAVARRYGVGARVHYLGFLPPAEVPRFLTGADVLLLPLGDNAQSRYFTSPMKLFEYAASGVPMVVTRQPTTESLVENDVQALMVAPGSAGDLAAAVARLLADRPLGNRLAARAKEWVAQYSCTERAARYEQFLDALAHAA